MRYIIKQLWPEAGVILLNKNTRLVVKMNVGFFDDVGQVESHLRGLSFFKLRGEDRVNESVWCKVHEGDYYGFPMVIVGIQKDSK